MKRSVLTLVVIAGALIVGLLAATQAMSSGTVEADQRAIAAANGLVQAGHYDQAATIYHRLLAQGVEDAAVYYNLGNVAMAQNDPTSAEAYYRQAAELKPRDADIRHNLALAREQAGDTSSDDGPRALVAEATRSVVTVNELALLALGAWFLFGFLVLAYRHFQPGRRPAVLRYAAAGALMLVVLSGVALFSRLPVA